MKRPAHRCDHCGKRRVGVQVVYDPATGGQLDLCPACADAHQAGSTTVDTGHGSNPGLPAGAEDAGTRMATRVPGMGGTGLEPVPPESDIGDGSGTEGPGKATSAGDSEGPERPLAVSTGPDRTPGIGASGSKAGLVACADRRCGHPRGWHRLGLGSCLECGCTGFAS